MANSRFQIVNEVRQEKQTPDDWVLCLQWGRYIYDDGKLELGYRFIWRDLDDKLRPQRGQARIQTLEDVETLIKMARSEGWGNNVGDD